jgi:hypothetical protein
MTGRPESSESAQGADLRDRSSLGNSLPMEMPTSSTMGLTTRELYEALGLERAPFASAHVDRERLATLAEHIRTRPDLAAYEPARWDDDRFWLVEAPDELRSQFFAVGNAINFRFWTLTSSGVAPASGTLDGQHLRGSMFMWRALRRTLEQGTLPLLDAGFLARLSRRDFDCLFTDDEGVNPLSVAADDRIANLRDLGQILSASWGGDFINVVRATDGSLVDFSARSREFRAFDDPVQKLTMVNAILHSGSGVYPFRDQPVPAIDYHLLKHALRQGMVRVSSDLSRKLLTGELLSSDEGQGLRRVALEAFVELADLAGVSGEILDNKYWLNRVNCADQAPVCLDPVTADQCPFLPACRQFTDYGLPVELTRYY